MSLSDERTLLKLVTVGDFDPQADQEIEYDFIGREIAGRYTVRKHIGGGGMADVFQATDEQLAIDVAIKLLKPRMAASPPSSPRRPPAPTSRRRSPRSSSRR